MNYYQSKRARIERMSVEEIEKEIKSYKFLYQCILDDIKKVELEKLNFVINAREQVRKVEDDDSNYYYYTYTDEDNKVWEFDTKDDMVKYVFEEPIYSFNSDLKDYLENLDDLTYELQKRNL